MLKSLFLGGNNWYLIIKIVPYYRGLLFAFYNIDNLYYAEEGGIMNWRLYWNQIVSIIWKELLATFKDPKTRIILLLPVIIQGFLFGYAATYNLNKVPYVLIDESHTQTAAALESTINSSGVFELYQSANSPDIIAPLIDSTRLLWRLSYLRILKKT